MIEIKEKVDEIKKRIPDSLNDIEKVLFLYEYLGKKVKYDKRITNKDERQSHDSKSIYDVLFNNKGVCSSFAIAFKALMDATNIECQVYTYYEDKKDIAGRSISIRRYKKT